MYLYFLLLLLYFFCTLQYYTHGGLHKPLFFCFVLLVRAAKQAGIGNKTILSIVV